MNWYKKSQDRHYTDTGYSIDSVLWISDRMGGNFQMHKSDDTETLHADVFETMTDIYWGRYDPNKKIVTINTPLDENDIMKQTSIDEIPNRLINRLISEFPGASIYGFQYGNSTQII